MPNTKTLTDTLELLLKIFAVLGVLWAAGAWCLQLYRRWRERQVLEILRRLKSSESISVDGLRLGFIEDVVGDVKLASISEVDRFPLRVNVRHRWRKLFIPSEKTIGRGLDRLEDAGKVERSITGNHWHIKRQQSGRGL